MKKKVITAFLPFTFLISFSGIYGQQWGDYTLYSTMNSTNAYLVDTSGTTYHTWTGLTRPTGYSSYLMPGGILWRSAVHTSNSFSGGPICGRVQKVDYNGTLLWDYTYSTTNYCSHHDICPMPNGNVLLIAYERKTAAEVLNAGCTTFANEMWPDKIVEIEPTGTTTGTVVWEWRAWDHLVQNVDSTKNNYQTSIVNHPELMNINYSARKDWMHMNGLNYNPMLDQITFSCHNLNEIYVIDHSTTTAEAAGHTGGNSGKGGDILYRWGNPAAYGAAGSAVLNVVHDAHWIPEGRPYAGRLVGFNNNGVSMSQSCIDQIDVPSAGNYNYSITPGSAYSPSTYTKRINTNGHTSNMGSSQELPNGNILYCVALSGNIYEVDSTGTTLWSKNVGGNNAKAYRYQACYVNNPAPALPLIMQNGTTLNATTAATYQWYLDGNIISGANSQSYSPSQNGIYVVRITDSLGCVYRYSSSFAYPSTTAINELQENTVSIYPNPASGKISISGKILQDKDTELYVFDAMGKLILQSGISETIYLSSFPDGIYYLSIRNKSSLINKKIILIK